jgi:hypothetical protein
MVVLSIAVLLTGLLMPVLRQVRENAYRVICLSNLNQIGQGMAMFGHDNNDQLPYSAALRVDGKPQNLTMAWRTIGVSQWDGFGILFGSQYCDAPECFYCPSHHGDHPYERYAELWQDPQPDRVIHTNYHYGGDVDWHGNGRRRSLLAGHSLVLATDGLRTKSDFNHVTGMNVLRGDNSVRWRDDIHDIYNQLPHTEYEVTPPNYVGLWQVVESQH